MKGIVLAGGTGSRLGPLTKITSKQLLPVYDKPLIYYPISTLMLAGIREILIITTPRDISNFQDLLGDGSAFGISLTYATQPKPEGLAQTYLIAASFLGKDSSLMILGDNIFHGAGLGQELRHCLPTQGAHIFTYAVANPSQYGILTIDDRNRPVSIVEKPASTLSNLAVTGLYYFDNRVIDIARKVVPSSRGELEITSIIEVYLELNELSVTHLSRGAAWLDTGNPNSLNDAANYIRVVEERTGLSIACLEEVALLNGWVSKSELYEIFSKVGPSQYTDYVLSLLL